MKKWVAFLFVCLATINFSQTNISPQFSELKGMEDQLGNTHLFYRIYSHTENFPIYSYTYNDVYHLDLYTLSDSLFLRDYIESNSVMFNALSTNDYKFWNNNPNQFIYVGMIGGQDPVPFIYRFDQEYNLLNYFCCEVKNVDISKNDDSLINCGAQLYYPYEANSIRSFDGGFSWTPITDTLTFISLNPFDDKLLFLETYYGFLYRSTDAGNTFNLVDLLNQPAHSTSFIYDLDQLHIYRLFGNQTLRVSPNKGEPFSWHTKYSSDSEIYISNDESISGTIYLADKKNIFASTDYGDSFSLYKTLERKIVGIYKKPNSDKLYAATKYKIYEITPDTVQVIKSLPIPVEVLNYYPLSIGNYWVYGVYTNEGGNNIYWGDETRTIVDIPTTKLGSQVFLCLRKLINGEIDSTYIKLDSLSGKLYASSTGYGDYLFYEDLLAEAGDTVCYEYNPVWNCQFVQPDSQFTEFGLNTLIKKYFPQAPGWYFGHSLVRGIGLYEVYNGDLTTFKSILKGCVIDGVVYGDTLTVAVEDEAPPITTSFNLEQNYPNPFNPSTKIKFTIPQEVRGERREVSLKVYDILGNEVATLVNEEPSAGEYEVEFDGTGLPSGIYFYQLKSGSFVETKKMVLLK